jgi:Flp pilus assembly protein TadG
VSYAQTVTSFLDNPHIIALTEIQDDTSSAKICTFTHVASGTYCTVKNAAAGSGAEITVISSNANETLKITPKGTGSIVLDNNTLPTSDGSNTQILKTNGSGTLSWSDVLVSLDSSPQLGANLNVGSYNITAGGSDYILVDSATDVLLKLGDASGSKKISIKDSGNTEISSIN